MRTTRHAQVQQQRRAIQPDMLEMVLCYGEEHKARAHATMYRISRKELLFVKSDCADPLWRRYRDSLSNTVPIVAGDGAVLTAMHRYRRIWKLK